MRFSGRAMAFRPGPCSRLGRIAVIAWCAWLDLDAVELAEHYASLVRRPVAVVRKTRVTGATVHAEDIAGDVAGRLHNNQPLGDLLVRT